MHVLRNLRVLVDIERTPNTRDEFSVWLSDLASALERGLVAQAPAHEEALSVLLRGMARRVGEMRADRDEWKAAAEAEAWLLDQAQAKPNPWFTAPNEFPLEAAEREDRERTSIGYAFPTQEWRQQQLDEAPTIRTEVSA